MVKPASRSHAASCWLTVLCVTLLVWSSVRISVEHLSVAAAQKPWTTRRQRQQQRRHQDNRVYAIVSKTLRQAQTSVGRLVMHLRLPGQKNHQRRPTMDPLRKATGRFDLKPPSPSTGSTSSSTTCPCFTATSIQSTILSARNTTDHCDMDTMADEYSWISWSTAAAADDDDDDPRPVVQEMYIAVTGSSTCRVGGTAVPVSIERNNISVQAHRDCIQHFREEFEDSCRGSQTYRSRNTPAMDYDLVEDEEVETEEEEAICI